MDAFNFDCRSPANNFISRDDPAPESATGMFSAQPPASSDPDSAAAKDILFELNKPQSVPAPAEELRPPAPPFQAPDAIESPPVRGQAAGEFTRFFQGIRSAGSPGGSLDADPAVIPQPGTSSAPPQSMAWEKKAARTADITSIFTQLRPLQQPGTGTPSVPPQPAAGSSLIASAAAPQAAVSAAPPPGEFTKMMQAFARPETAPPVSGKPTATENRAASSPVPLASEASVPAPSPPAPPAPQAPTGSAPDSFTSVFASIVSPPGSSAQPASFANSQVPSGPPRSCEPAPENEYRVLPEETPKERSVAAASRNNATRLFESPSHALSESPAGPQPPLASPFESQSKAWPSSNPVRPAEFPFAGAQPPGPKGGDGGFTKLFQALSDEKPVAADELRFSSPPLARSRPPAQKTPMPSGPGEFTRLMNALGESPAHAEQDFFPATPVAAPAPPPPQGPGEFTRIISASGFREGIADGPAPPAAAPSPAASAPPSFKMPPLPNVPAAPHLPIPAAHAPVPQSAPAQSAPAQPAPQFQMPPAPPPPAMPKAALPPAPAPAAARVSRLQEYLPILLVANAFLLLLLVIIVFFALRHH